MWRGAVSENNHSRNGCESVALFASPGTYPDDPRVKHFQHMSVAQCAILFWQNGVPAGKRGFRVSFMGFQLVATPSLGFTNLVRNYSQGFVDIVVHENDLTEAGQMLMQRHELRRVGIDDGSCEEALEI